MSKITYLPKQKLYLCENKLYELDGSELIQEIDYNIPIKQEIEVISADEAELEPFDHNGIIITSKKKIGQRYSVRKLMTGWTVKETIGIGVINPRAIAKARLMR